MKVEKLFGRSGVLSETAMRVRLNRSTPVPREDPPAKPRLRLVRDEFADERRLRNSGGPDDTATYNCACGYVFSAHVSTSVTCPHCGGDQAW